MIFFPRPLGPKSLPLPLDHLAFRLQSGAIHHVLRETLSGTDLNWIRDLPKYILKSPLTGLDFKNPELFEKPYQTWPH